MSDNGRALGYCVVRSVETCRKFIMQYVVYKT